MSRDTISQSHAELMASLGDPLLTESALGTVVDRGLSTRETEALVKSLLQQKEETSRRTPLLLHLSLSPQGSQGVGELPREFSPRTLPGNSSAGEENERIPSSSGDFSDFINDVVADFF